MERASLPRREKRGEASAAQEANRKAAEQWQTLGWRQGQHVLVGSGPSLPHPTSLWLTRSCLWHARDQSMCGCTWFASIARYSLWFTALPLGQSFANGSQSMVHKYFR